MSIIVDGLTKIYGQQKALDNISFSLAKGELVGFLGPNGAGKSTTMKIATAYVLPTAGTVSVGGVDVVENPLEVKRKIGYLPEHNPLYPDMYIKEFLMLAAKVQGLGYKASKARLTDMIALCGLSKEQHKKIGVLSKGYRQRVGLAQALIHDPEVLILDEPTTGLDPNQILEIRNLIKTVSTEKTVIFSSHIMQEVQAVCERVVIINNGKIVADNAVEQLTAAKENSVVIYAEFADPIDESVLKNAGVLNLQKMQANKYLIEADSDIRQQIFQLASAHHWALVGLQLEEGSLEQVFHKLTNS